MKTTKIVYSCDLCKNDITEPKAFKCKFGDTHLCDICINKTIVEYLNKIKCTRCNDKKVVEVEFSHRETAVTSCPKCAQ